MVLSTEEKGTTGRVAWVDVLKCIGIFCIYLGHFGTAVGKFYSFVFIFHVPLFFFVSGFFSKSVLKENFFKYIWDRFTRIMIPYFVFALVAEFMIAVINNYNTHQTISDLYKYIFAVRNTLSAGSLWFFSCLFVVEVLYQALMLLVKNKYVVLIIAIALRLFFVVDTPALFWNIDSALTYMFFMF